MPVSGYPTHAFITWKTNACRDELKGHSIRLRVSGRNLTAYNASFEA